MSPAHSAPEASSNGAGRRYHSVVLPAWARFLQQRGLDADAVLGPLGFTGAASQEWTPVSVAELEQVGEACARATGELHFGLTAGQELNRGGLGLIEFLACSAPDLGVALERVAEAASLLGGASLFRVCAGQRWTLVEHLAPGFPAGLGHHTNTFILARLLQVMTFALGRPPRLARAFVAHSCDLEAHSELRRALGAPHLDSGLETNGLIIASEELRAPLPGHDPRLLKLLSSQLAARGKSAPVKDDFELRLREQVAEALPSGAALEAVSRGLGMARRTVQRRITSGGRSYSEVVQQERLRQVLLALAEPPVALDALSERLGYQEPASFLRAFHRWTGRRAGALVRAVGSRARRSGSSPSTG